jgi:hypothetical protein
MAASLFILVRTDVSLNECRISLLLRLFSEPVILQSVMFREHK